MDNERRNKSVRTRDRVRRLLERSWLFPNHPEGQASSPELQERTNTNPASQATSPISSIPDSTRATDGGQYPVQYPTDSLGGTDNARADSSHCEHSLSQSGHSLWKQAVDKLESNDRETIEHGLNGSNLDVPIQEVLKGLVSLAEGKKQDFETSEMEAPDPAGKEGSKVAIWTLMPKILVCVRRFKEIGDIAVGFDPVHAALPWAAAITVSHEQAGLLLAGLERVSYLALRSGVYQTMYLTQSSSLDKQSKDLLSTALVNLYREILKFLALAIRRFSTNQAHQSISALFNPSIVSDALSALENCASRATGEATRCHEILTKNALGALSFQVETLHKLIDDSAIKLDTRIEEMRLMMKNEEQGAILGWLSKVQYQTDHDFARKGHVKSTGRWLLEHPTFMQWQSCDSNSIFWLHGIPGAGKTKLTANVVENILQTLESGSDHAVAYFYCDGNSEEHRDPNSVLLSIIRQLASGKVGKQGLNRCVYDLYREQKALSFPREALTIETCAELIPKLVTSYSTTTIVVDGLDECDRHSGQELINIFDSLIKHSDCNCEVKIFISSRNDWDLRREYVDGTHLEVGVSHNNSDIRKYVEEKLNMVEKLVIHESLSSDLRDEILKTFDNKSDGMFQWAVIQMNELSKFSRQSDLKSQLSSYLSKLPKGLEETYKQIMDHITSLPGSEPDVARRAFWCIIDARRRLSPEELVAAVLQPPDEEDIFIDPDVGIDFVLESCRNLIVQDGAECKLSHLSVGEFLESYGPMKPCHREVHLLGKVCLQILLKQHKTEQRHVLGHYAKNHWHAHFTKHNFKDPDVKSTELLLEFLSPPEARSDPLDRWYQPPWGARHYHALGAFVAVEYGLVTLLDYWFDRSELDPNLCYEDESLLYRVTKEKRTREDVLQRLLQRGANVNARMGLNGRGPTALLSAVGENDPHQVRLLVHRLGAQVNHGEDNDNISPLCCAIREKCFYSKKKDTSNQKAFEVLKILLEAGADPNFTDGCGTALPALHLNVRCYYDYKPAPSARFYREEYDPKVTEVLLDYNADINLQTTNFKTPLEMAVTSLNVVAVEQLVSLGADCNLARLLYMHLDNILLLHITDINFRPYVDVVQQLVNGGALDYVLHLPPGQKTKQDLEYEGRVAMLAACMTKTDSSGDAYDYKGFFERVRAAKQQGVPFTSATLDSVDG